MAKPPLTITHPDGTVSTRQSARPYLFGVVSSPLDLGRHRAYLEAEAALDLESIEALEAALVSPEAKLLTSRPTSIRDLNSHGTPAYSSFEAELEVGAGGRRKDVFIRNYCNSNSESQAFRGEPVVPVLDALVARATSRVKQISGLRPIKLRKIESIDAGVFDAGPFTVVRWTSRRDLAVALLSSFGWRVHVGHTITIAPVDKK